MTRQTLQHVAYVQEPRIAEHVCQLHNRTLGDGQDPPPKPRVAVEEIEPQPGETITLDPGETLNDSVDAAVWAREFMKRFQGDWVDEGTMLSWFANAIQNGVRSVANRGVLDAFLEAQADGTVNPRRSTLPADLQLSRHFGPPGTARVEVDIRGALDRLLGELVSRRVAEYAARQPARIEVHESPVMMANLLVQLGWKVEPPEETP
jgi:hypothetical protein